MNGYRFDRLKILVVDDNVHMRKLVTTILHAFGVARSMKPTAASAPGPSYANPIPTSSCWTG
jgi:CheY-like chemotaxis protein